MSKLITDNDEATYMAGYQAGLEAAAKVAEKEMADCCGAYDICDACNMAWIIAKVIRAKKKKA